jgi:hypothetical protein
MTSFVGSFSIEDVQMVPVHFFVGGLDWIFRKRNWGFYLVNWAARMEKGGGGGLELSLVMQAYCKSPNFDIICMMYAHAPQLFAILVLVWLYHIPAN